MVAKAHRLQRMESPKHSSQLSARLPQASVGKSLCRRCALPSVLPTPMRDRLSRKLHLERVPRLPPRYPASSLQQAAASACPCCRREDGSKDRSDSQSPQTFRARGAHVRSRLRSSSQAQLSEIRLKDGCKRLANSLQIVTAS